jgi:hypothetical protein
LLARVQLSAEYPFPSELVDRARPQHQGIADAKLVASERPRAGSAISVATAARSVISHITLQPDRFGSEVVRSVFLTARNDRCRRPKVGNPSWD